MYDGHCRRPGPAAWPLRLRRAALALATLAACGSAVASDLILKPDSYRLEPGAASSAAVLNGSIEKSRNAVDWSRVAAAQVLSGEEATALSAEAWNVDGDAARVAFDVGPAGTRVLGVSTKPRVVEFTAVQFAAYLERYGLTDGDAASRPDGVRERYSKHARAVVQVGDARSDDHRRSLGQPLEIIFEQNPYDLKFGRNIGFRVVAGGKPLSNVAARAGCEGFHGHDERGEHISHYALRTDETGRAEFLLSQKCVWYVSAIALRPSGADDVDYESHWATATFEVF